MGNNKLPYPSLSLTFEGDSENAEMQAWESSESQSREPET